jgi:putative FmdB family regulatory protein
MPIYEYQCGNCGHHLEALQKISDKPLRECPECGRHRLKRLMSAPLFRLAGSGWYETDFKSDKEQKRNLLDKGEREAAASGDNAAGAADAAKPEPKAEPKVEAKHSAPAPSKKPRRTAARPAARAAAKPAPRRKAPARGRRR